MSRDVSLFLQTIDWTALIEFIKSIKTRIMKKPNESFYLYCKSWLVSVLYVSILFFKY